MPLTAQSSDYYIFNITRKFLSKLNDKLKMQILNITCLEVQMIDQIIKTFNKFQDVTLAQGQLQAIKDKLLTIQY